METSTISTAGAGVGSGSGAGTSAGASSTGAGASVASSTPTGGAGQGNPVAAGPGSGTVQDGVQGAGALDSNAAVEAMVAAAAAKGYGQQNTDSAAVSEDTPLVDPTATPEEVTPEAVSAEGDNAEAEHSYTLEQDGFVGARDLAAKIEADPALKAALSPELRNEIMANARLAERGAAYQQMFASPEEAQVISDSAKEFAGFQEAFVSVTPTNVAQGTTSLINMMLQASVRRDEDGNPVMKDGKPVTDGTVGRFLTETAKRWIDHNITKKVESLNDESLTAAFDMVMERVGLRPSTADQGQEVDQAFAARKAELDRQEADLRKQRETAQTEATTSYKSTLNTQLGQVWESEMGKLLTAASGLSEFDREAVSQQIDAAVKKEIRASTAYRREKDLLEMRPMGDKRRAAEVKQAQTWLRTNLVRIASPFLAKAGVSVTGKAVARQEAQAAREQASRGEVKAGSAVQVKRGATPQTPAQERAAVSEALSKTLGRQPSDSEVNQEMMIQVFNRRKSA